MQHLRGDVSHRVGVGDDEGRATHDFMNSCILMPIAGAAFAASCRASPSSTSSSTDRAEILLDAAARFALHHFKSSGRHGMDIFHSPSVGDFGSASSLTSSCVIA